MRKNYTYNKILILAIATLFVGINIISSAQSAPVEKYFSIMNPSETLKGKISNELGYINWTVNGTMGNNGWYISPINLSCTYDHELIDKIYYYYNGEWIEYTKPFTLYNQGQISFEWYAVDYQGEIWPFSFPFRIDYTAPSIELSVERIGFIKWRFNATVVDTASGIIAVGFYLDGQFLENVTGSPWVFYWSGTGDHSVEAIAYDAAGNNASTKTPDSYNQCSQIHQFINQYIYNQENQFFLKMLKRYQSNIL